MDRSPDTREDFRDLTPRRYSQLTISAAIIFAILRIYSVTGYASARELGDTSLYFKMAEGSWWSSELWFGARPPLTSIFFKLCNNSPTAIKFAQCIFSIIGWSALAFAWSSLYRRNYLKLIVVVLVLSFGLNRDVILWDGVLLSESSALSTSLLFIAAAIAYAQYADRLH